jgi:hypothetical protein
MNALASTLRQRYQDWVEDGAVPYWIAWNRRYRRRLVIGGGRTHGWMLTPQLVVDLRNLTCGIYWQHHGEDPQPFFSLHIPGVYLGVSIAKVAPGYRARASARTRGEAA